MYRKTGTSSTQHPYDQYVLGELGLITTTVKPSPLLTRACMVTAAFGSFETQAIIGCECIDTRSDLLKEGTQSLAVYHAKQDFSLNGLSDLLVIAQKFRTWFKSSLTARQDGKPKFWHPQLKLPSIGNKWDDNEFNNEDFIACRPSAFDKLDEDVFDNMKEYQSKELTKGITQLYQSATTDDEKRKVRGLFVKMLQIMYRYIVYLFTNRSKFFKNSMRRFPCIVQLHLNNISCRPRPGIDVSIHLPTFVWLTLSC